MLTVGFMQSCHDSHLTLEVFIRELSMPGSALASAVLLKL